MSEAAMPNIPNMDAHSGEIYSRPPPAQAPVAPDPSWRLEYDAWGRLVLIDATGKQHVGVQVMAPFRCPAPRQSVSICDGEGREIVWIDELEELSEGLRKQVEDHLSRT